MTNILILGITPILCILKNIIVLVDMPWVMIYGKLHWKILLYRNLKKILFQENSKNLNSFSKKILRIHII